MINFYLSIDDTGNVIDWHKSDRLAVQNVKHGGSIQYVKGLILDGTPYVSETVGDRIYYDKWGKRTWNTK